MMVLSHDTKLPIFETWKVAQENIRHFNEILIRVRGGSLFLLAAATTAVVAVENLGQLVLGGILLGASIAFLGLYTIDRWYYHVLLLATVRWARHLEQTMFVNMPSGGLAEFVAEEYSRVSWIRPKHKKSEEAKRTASDRVAFFYGLLIMGSIGGSVMALTFPSEGYASWKHWVLVFTGAFLITGIPMFLLEIYWHRPDRV